MDVPLSRRAFRLLDGASKAVGLAAIVAALGGVASPHSVLVGLVGVGVGVATAFLSPREAPADPPDDREDGPDDAYGWRPVTGLARRLWHDRLARLGGGLWLAAFGLAGTGVALRGAGVVEPATTLLALSGPVGLGGVLAVAVAGGRHAIGALRA
ncbi:MAG: hypothetical protein ABEJ81_05065 [Haloferacaceae archaeon]